MPSDDLDRRLWRVRRRGDWIDATLESSASGWTLHYSRNGRMLVTREFPTREQATRAAATQLREFQRVGWNEHW
jgi:hypothetical protein